MSASDALAQNRKMLAFAKLESFTRFGLAVFLTFNHTRVTCNHVGVAQGLAEFLIKIDEGPGNTQLDRFSLAGGTATACVDHDIELS